jgi:hypothetical protein
MLPCPFVLDCACLSRLVTRPMHGGIAATAVTSTDAIVPSTPRTSATQAAVDAWYVLQDDCGVCLSGPLGLRDYAWPQLALAAHCLMCMLGV